MANVDSIPPIIPLTNHVHVKDLTGQIFGRLTVLGFGGIWNTGKLRKAQWVCRCECGTYMVTVGARLVNGRARSCGCRQRIGKHRETANGHTTPEMRAYVGARRRCTKPSDRAYKDYGGRGIEFRFNSVEEFIKCVGRRPSDQHSLDRIDVNGHYEAGNLRWATWNEQGRNKRNTRHITIDGVTKSATEWAEINGLSKSAGYARLRQGYCVECAFTIPVGGPRCPHSARQEQK